MASGKHLNIDLSFRSDTSAVQKDIQKLQGQLDNLLKTTSKSTGQFSLNKELHEASKAAIELKQHLEKAVNVNTGSLDVGMLNKSFKQAGTSLEEYRQKLSKLGPEGEKVFSSFAKTLINAEVPLRKTNALLSEFATTLKNTARWQISSSILHGFMGSLQSAFYYAQDLNKSLNNIRIVTGYNTDQMAKFAQEANKAAQALSTTTTEYTNASLIYYQQGLDDEAVKKRTDVTIKMANVSRESAEEVSQQMTAIWNNFDDGSKSLEYYSDVVTALGAATASSSAEIAEGLEKFAAVANTVGLSYEYATAALATVTATTRQSADVVGNAFKTLFARLEGLKLGETLDDGTDLNKYSQALATIGINIKKTDGELKEMDQILDELGAKWKTLSEAEQMALAQTVGGVRQYTQLIALMKEWDFFQENLNVARDSEGTLQKQADIYAESWEAASKRVKTAWQGIYQQILDDNFFIELTNSVGNVIEGMGKFIDSLGGFKSILPGLSSLLLSLFGKDLASGINNAIYNIKLFTNKTKSELEELRNSFNIELSSHFLGNDFKSDTLSYNTELLAKAQQALLDKQKELAASNNELNSSEIALSQSYLDNLHSMNEENLGYAKRATSLEEEIGLLKEKLNTLRALATEQGVNVPHQNYFSGNLHKQEQYSATTTAFSSFSKVGTKGFDKEQNYNEIAGDLEKVYERLTDLDLITPKVGTAMEKFFNTIKNGGTYNEKKKTFANIKSEIAALGVNVEKSTQKIKTHVKGQKELSDTYNTASVRARAYGTEIAHTVVSQENLKKATDNVIKTFKTFQGNSKQFGDYIVGISHGISSLTMGINSLSSIGKTLSNDDLSWGEKLTQTFMSASMGIPMVISGMTKLKQTFSELPAILDTLALKYTVLDAAKAKNVALDQKHLPMILKIMAANGVESTQLKDEAVMQTMLNTLKQQGVNIEDKELINTLNLIAEQNALSGTQKGLILSQNALNISMKGFASGLKSAAMGAKQLWAAIWPLGIAVGVVTAALFAFKRFEQNQKESDEQAQATAKSHKELTDSLVTERDELRKLSDEYHKLDSGSENYKASVVSLMEEHKNQEGVVLALTEQYEKLNDVLKEQEQIKNEAVLSSAKIDQQYAHGALVGSLRQNIKDAGGDVDNFGQTIDLEGFNSRSTREKEFQAALEEILGEDAFKGAWNHLKIDSLAEGLINDSEAIKKVLKQYGDLEASTQLSKYIADVDELIKDIDETTDRINDIELENIFTDVTKNISFDESFDASNYIRIIENAQQIAKDHGLELTEQEISEWVRKKIQAIDEVAEYAKAADIAQLLIDKNGIEGNERYLDEVLNLFTKRISDFSESDQAYIALHPYWAFDQLINSTDFDAEKISEAITNQSKYNNAKTTSNSALSIIQNIGNSKKGEFTDADRSAAYDLLGIAVNSVTDDELYARLVSFYQKAIGETNNFFEEAQKEAEEYLGKSERAYSDAQTKLNGMQKENLAGDLKNIYEQSLEGLEDWEITQKLAEFDIILADLESNGGILENLANYVNGIGVSDEAVDSITTLWLNLGAIADTAVPDLVKANQKLDKEYKEQEKEVNRLNKLYNEQNSEYERIKEQQLSYSDVLDGYQKIIENINQSLNDLQGAYKTIVSAQEEYAENGYYTTDAIQSLLDLGPEYLKYIRIENDEIKLSTTAMQNQAIAYYDKMEAMYAEQAATEIQIILNKEKREEEYEELKLTYARISMQAALNGTLDDTINTLENLAKAGDSAAQGMYKYYQNVKNIIELGRKSSLIDFNGSFGGSSKEGSIKDYEKYTTELADRYHDLNEAIEKTEHSMSMLEKAQDRLSGANLIASLKEQNKLLEQQQKQYKALGKELKTEQAELQSSQRLAQFGAKFNEDGTVSNYANVFTTIENQYLAAVNKYNESVHEYNTMSKDAQKERGDQMLKDAKNELDAAKEFHDKAQDWLERSDEVAAELRDLEEKYIERQLKKIDNNFKRFETKFQLKFDIADAKKALLGFLRTAQKDFTKIYKDRSDWITGFNSYKSEAKQDLNKVNANAQKVSDIRSIIDNENYEYGGNGALFASRDEAIQKYLEASQELMDNGEELYDLYKTAYNDYLSAIDEVTDQWNDVIDGFDQINDTLDHYQKIAEMLYDANSKAGMETMDKIYGASANNSLLKQEALKKEIASLEKELAQIGGDENNEDVKKITEAIKSANSELQSEVENYLSTIQNQLINSIHQIMDSVDREMSNGLLSLSTVSERWDDAKAAADGYYDEVERVYQLEKLESSWNNALKDTKTLKSQQQIKTIMDAQLKNLKEKTELSKYDIELAEKELEITKAQMALEDAQNNKNSMKLVRNEQGNWSYQYVADTEDVAEKEQKVIDLLYDKYNFVKQASENATTELLELQQTAQERLTALMEEYKYADKERRKQIEEEYNYLYKYYYGENGLIVKKSREASEIQKDLNIAGMETLWGLYIQDEENFDKMTKNQQNLIEELRKKGLDSFSDLTAKIATDSGSFYNEIQAKASSVISETKDDWQKLAEDIVQKWGTNSDSVENTIKNAYKNIMDKVSEYDQAIANSEKASGEAWGHTKTSINEVTKSLSDKQNGLIAKVDELTSKTNNLSTFKKKVDDIKSSFDKAANSIATATNNLDKYLKLLTKQSEYTIKIKFDDGGGYQVNIPKSQTIDIKYNDTGSGSGGTSTKKYDIVEHNTAYVGDYKTTQYKGLTWDEADKIISENKKRGTWIIQEQGTYVIEDKLKKSGGSGSAKGVSNISTQTSVKLATGGYTGEWGPEGKFAMLHEKELVLNK